MGGIFEGEWMKSLELAQVVEVKWGWASGTEAGNGDSKGPVHEGGSGVFSTVYISRNLLETTVYLPSIGFRKR